MRKVARLICCLLVLIGLTSPALAETSEGKTGLAYGSNHAYFLKAPQGWILDNESGAEQGVYAVFYPRGSSWNGPVAIYSNASDRAGRNIEAAIEEDFSYLKKKSAKLDMTDAGTLVTRDGKTAVLKFFSNDNWGNSECCAYIAEKDVVVHIVLTARERSLFESALPSFRQLVASYKFISAEPDKCNLQKLASEEGARDADKKRTCILRFTQSELPQDKVNPAEVMLYQRCGIDYARLEVVPREGSPRLLCVANKEDIWSIDNEKKTATHIKDHGPIYGMRLPICSELCPSRLSPVGDLEYGNEYDFFVSHAAKKSTGKTVNGSATDQYELSLDGIDLKLVTAKDSTIPLKLTYSNKTVNKVVDYISVHQADFDAKLYALPDGFKIVETEGAPESKEPVAKKQHLATAKAVLDAAGVKAAIADEIKIDDKDSIFVLTIDKTDAANIAEKLSAVSKETGYCPLFPYAGKIKEIADNVSEQIDSWQQLATRSVSAPAQDPPEEKNPPQDSSAPAENSESWLAQMSPSKKLEMENLRSTFKKGMSRSAALLAAGEQLNVDEWLKLNGKPDRPVGDFSKRKHQLSEIPVCDKLLLVPVQESWQIPSILTFSGCGWNECPPTQVHIAFLKRWHEKYGAELLCMGKDSLYLLVKKPVQTREEALSLATEQYPYCPDNVLQGGGNSTLSGGAIDLLDAKIWEFWWD